jgi:carbon monoxide dehydrogenase subunit G
MNLENQFRVDVPVEQTWAVLLDIERIAPCMPGAQLQEVEGDEYRGIVKVKVGPITAQYKGAARLAEVDGSAHRAVIKADGRDTRGQGNASATVTAQLTPDGGGTQVQVSTELSVTGKVAQFGRGVMADVSSKLLDQFVECLEREVLTTPAATTVPPRTDDSAPAEAPAATSAPPPAAPTPTASAEPGVRMIDAPDAEPVDLMKAAGGAVAKRVIPLVIVVAIVVVVVVILLTR